MNKKTLKKDGIYSNIEDQNYKVVHCHYKSIVTSFLKEMEGENL